MQAAEHNHRSMINVLEGIILLLQLAAYPETFDYS